ncbi:ATP-dependent endonuclease [Curtobacterium sp. 8I-2]|jgi:putative ATP-dependent endonuclease of OLD family|nr:ATP-dependent endonuclease [Curtobacterium sp. 8I-2]
MIRRVLITGYRTYQRLEFEPHPEVNVLVGDNEAGKSTLLEAMTLALTGRLNGRPAAEELNPHSFNQRDKNEFFEKRRAGEHIAPPEIHIEVELEDRDEFAKLIGANNSYAPARDVPGVTFHVIPDPEYGDEFEEYVAASSTGILPVEYYRTEWTSFQGTTLVQRPKQLAVATIDARTVRSGTGVDYHLRQILNDYLDPKERASVSVAFRRVKDDMTSDHFGSVNDRLSTVDGTLEGRVLSVAMDQSARGSWDTAVVPHVADVPFALAGLGQQAVIKIVLAMQQAASGTGVVMVEEPENHLSHTSLNRLLHRMSELSGSHQQLFVATHSSFVLNRLGLDHLRIVSANDVHSFAELDAKTTSYFRKLPGFDTLRIALAEKIVLVEGPSDEILFERFFRDRYQKRPIEAGIEVFAMGGLSLKRFLALARLLGKHCAVLTDNDGRDLVDLEANLADYVDDRRRVFFGDASGGPTLEPQLVHANGEPVVRATLGVAAHLDLATWMKNNKTEGAIRIADSTTMLFAPAYFVNAMQFIHEG